MKKHEQVPSISNHILKVMSNSAALYIWTKSQLRSNTRQKVMYVVATSRNTIDPFQTVFKLHRRLITT